MNQDMFKLNILAIIGFGGLIIVLGISLYLFKGAVAPLMRYFLPIPPLGVAAYVFVFNLYSSFGEKLPEKKWDLIREIFLGTGIAMLIFGGMVLLLVVFLHYARRW